MDLSSLSLTGWPLVVLVFCVAASYLVRKVLPNEHFFQSKIGAAVLAGASAVISAIIPVVQSKGVDVNALLHAALGALGTLGFISNPSVPTGVNIMTMKKPSTVPAVPVLPPLAVFLPLFCFLFFTGCAGAKAFGTCELNSLPQTSQSVIACVSAAATQSAGIDAQADIGGCVAGLAGTQGNCIIQAIIADFQKSVPAHGQASAEVVNAIARLQIYLNSHGGKVSCGEKERPLLLSAVRAINHLLAAR